MQRLASLTNLLAATVQVQMDLRLNSFHIADSPF